ncbi:MAG: N-acetyltransferase [Actinomycetia bacterium]|nr:N-acetyltransferase [Actinomycetes bacterium]
MAPQIHDTAVVEKGSTVGDATVVWHHTHIRTGAAVGAGCTLGKNVFLDADVTVGDGVKIQNNVSVFKGVTLADRVFVGPSAVFTNDLVPRAFSTRWEIVPTLVQEGASIGANATVICGSTIGSYAMVGAGSVVTRDVADHQLVLGNPARAAGWVCTCGSVLSREPEPPSLFLCSSCASGNNS